jgi:hypothetical protein
LLLVYISKRYQWPFARVWLPQPLRVCTSANMNKVGYLFTLKAVVNVFMQVVCVPGFHRVMAEKAWYSPAQVDILGSKIALWMLAVGAFAIGMSSELWMLIVCESDFLNLTSLPLTVSKHWRCMLWDGFCRSSCTR